MEMKELMSQFPYPGKVIFIGLRPARRESMSSVDSVNAIVGKGLEGDRYNTKGGSRQVTLIQQEHLQAAASYLHLDSINPLLTRRNIVIKGINLLTLKGKKFRIGSAVLEYSGECHPCSRMEENLGIGGYNAMRGHGGITARILESGIISTGDSVSVIPEVMPVTH